MPKGKAKPEINKMKEVREVLETKGKDTMPLDIQKEINQKTGVKLSTSLISNYKGKILGGVRKKKGRKPGGKAASVAAGHDAGSGRRNGSAESISIEDISQVKKLVDIMGAEKVRQLAMVLAK